MLKGREMSSILIKEDGMTYTVTIKFIGRLIKSMFILRRQTIN